MAARTGCVDLALTREAFERSLAEAGLVDVEIRETRPRARNRRDRPRTQARPRLLNDTLGCQTTIAFQRASAPSDHAGADAHILFT